MKSFRWRHLLIWLLLLLLPIKGVMAASMLLCGPNHHGAPEASAGAPVQSASVEHRPHQAHHAGQPHHAGHHADQHAGQNDATVNGALEDGTSTFDGDLTQDKARCNACAPCSMGAVPAADTSWAPTVRLGRSIFPALATNYLSADPDRALRPPRSIRR